MTAFNFRYQGLMHLDKSKVRRLYAHIQAQSIGSSTTPHISTDVTLSLQQKILIQVAVRSARYGRLKHHGQRGYSSATYQYLFFKKKYGTRVNRITIVSDIQPGRGGVSWTKKFSTALSSLLFLFFFFHICISWMYIDLYIPVRRKCFKMSPRTLSLLKNTRSVSLCPDGRENKFTCGCERQQMTMPSP